jgi:hypothetical protein
VGPLASYINGKNILLAAAKFSVHCCTGSSADAFTIEQLAVICKSRRKG